MKATITTAAVLSCLVFAASASAQTRGFSDFVPAGGIRAQHHSSTYEEGVLRGTADRIRAQGEFNRRTAEANLIHQETISRALDNDVKYAATYFEKQRINREGRAYKRGDPATPETLARWNRSRGPRRLAAHEFQPAIGKLYWPVALMGPEFTQGRQIIERLFANRNALDAGFGAPIPRQVSNIAGQMRSVLHDQFGSMPAYEYIAGKSFLINLGYEAQFAPELQGVAAN